MRDECGKDRSLNLEGVDKRERERQVFRHFRRHFFSQEFRVKVLSS